MYLRLNNSNLAKQFKPIKHVFLKKSYLNPSPIKQATITTGKASQARAHRLFDKGVKEFEQNERTVDASSAVMFSKKNYQIEVLLKRIKAFNRKKFDSKIPEIEFLEYLKKNNPNLVKIFNESKNQILEILIQDLVDYLLNKRDPLKVPPSEIDGLKRSLPSVYTLITGQRMREELANEVVDQYLNVNDQDYKTKSQRFNDLVSTFLNTSNKEYLKFSVPEIMENLPLIITKLIYDALLHDQEKVNGYNTDTFIFKFIDRLDKLQQDLRAN